MKRAILVASLWAALAAPAPGVVIDDFTVGAIELEDRVSNGYATATQTGLDPNHVAGGARQWRYDVRPQPSSDPPSTASVRMGVRPTPTGHYFYAADDLLTAVNMTIAYDANDAGAGRPGLGIDLAALRHNAVAFDVSHASFDHAGGFLDVAFGPVDGTGGHRYVPLPQSQAPYRLVVPLWSPWNSPLAPLDTLKLLRFGTGNGNLFGSFELARIVTTSTADSNFDDVVDGADFLAWQRSVGATPVSANPIAAGDANLDGAVDAGDLSIWQTAAAPATSPASQSVPEPGALAIALSAVVAAFQATSRMYARGRMGPARAVSHQKSDGLPRASG